ncbi:hypothetical protein Droror1_Dr00001106 [Drosera rotundifolia]
MGSWFRSITTPFRKSCMFLHNHGGEQREKGDMMQMQQREKKSASSKPGLENKVMDLQSEVMACGYEDIQVMWSMLDKSKHERCHVSP